MYPFTWVRRGYQQYKNTETYIAQLPSISTLYTASKFRLSKEAIDMIDLFMAEKAIKYGST